MDKPLRVTILYPDPLILGGVAIFIEAMRRALSRNVHTTHFLVGRRATTRGKLGALLNPFIDAFRLAWHLLRARPDVVHINPSLNTKSVLRDGLFLLVMRVFRKREVFMFMHGWEEELSALIARSRFLRPLFRYVYGWPRLTVVLASRFREQLIAMGFPSARIQVDSAMFDGGIFEGLARRKHTDLRLVFVSRLVPGKGMWELLEAYASLKPHFAELSLYIVGDGTERQRLIQTVAERGIPAVTITGYISIQEKAQILLDGDLFVFPTTYGEGCPASLLEAMAAGMPCITTGVGGIPDVFVDGASGTTLDHVTAVTVEKSITDMIGDSQRMARISQYNRDIAWKKYEAKPVTARMEWRYFEICNRR